MNKFAPLSIACLALAGFAYQVAQAEPLAGRGFTAQRGLAVDSQGHAAGLGGFTTASGAQGLRTGRIDRSGDGAISATGNASASGDSGSAARSGSFTRNSDGTASGERSTSVTNQNTGTSFDGSTSYTKGSGVSRSGSCKDSAGNTVSCGSR